MSRYISSPPRLHGPPRLLCFPHAGGGPSAYARWAALLGEATEVLPIHLPGHEGRFEEARFTSLDSLVTDLYADVVPYLRHPYVLYGHSMGAWIAYALAVRIADDVSAAGLGIRPPLALIVATCRAPHLDPPLPVPTDDSGLIEVLRVLGGTPPQLLDERDWLSVLLPLVRDDLRLCEDPLAPAAPLLCPITAIAVADDPLAPVEAVRGWRRHTRARFALRQVVGPHLCHRDAAPAVTSVVGLAIEQALRSRPPDPCVVAGAS